MAHCLGDMAQRVIKGLVIGNILFQWIGLRENLEETMVFTIKYRGVL
jgi:hypothetical protein